MSLSTPDLNPQRSNVNWKKGNILQTKLAESSGVRKKDVDLEVRMVTDKSCNLSWQCVDLPWEQGNWTDSASKK